MLGLCSPCARSERLRGQVPSTVVVAMAFCGDAEVCGLLDTKTFGQEISKVYQRIPYKK